VDADEIVIHEENRQCRDVVLGLLRESVREKGKAVNFMID
jgi:hypothetical protein